jgi:hypothetical protein
MATGKALLCLAVVGAAGSVVACGGVDGVLRIWDSRASRSEALVRILAYLQRNTQMQPTLPSKTS